jgi:hypothetical protein
MISNKSTSTRQQCKWISSLDCFKWHLDSSISSRIHKWCLDQLISDILQVVIMKIANVQEMPLLTNQSYMWYHISTHGINHTRWWFHKWFSTLSDHQVKKFSSPTRAQVYQVDDPYDIGRGVPSIGTNVKDSICGISRAIQVSFQHIW